jgi:hypothetical protein
MIGWLLNQSMVYWTRAAVQATGGVKSFAKSLTHVGKSVAGAASSAVADVDKDFGTVYLKLTFLPFFQVRCRQLETGMRICMCGCW